MYPGMTYPAGYDIPGYPVFSFVHVPTMPHHILILAAAGLNTKVPDPKSSESSLVLLLVVLLLLVLEYCSCSCELQTIGFDHRVDNKAFGVGRPVPFSIFDRVPCVSEDWISWNFVEGEERSGQRGESGMCRPGTCTREVVCTRVPFS